MKEKTKKDIEQLANKKYSAGFISDIKTYKIPMGLNEDIIKLISEKKNEPKDILKLRLSAFKKWKEMKEPKWADFEVPTIDYQKITYYSSPITDDENSPKSLEEINPEIKKVYDRLGIPLQEQELIAGIKKTNNETKENKSNQQSKIAIDAVFDSVSVATTYKDQLAALGIIFCSFSEAIQNHYELIKEHMCSVVPITDSYYSALNTAVFSDGTFVYIPKGIKCPIDLGSYFRINAKEAGQFERTLIIADEGSEVNYLEGCSAPQYDTNQLHVAVVELIAKENSTINYSTVQNWYPGDKSGKGGIYNFVTKRGIAHKNAKISWTQMEVGSALTWKYPSCILLGDNSTGEFFSIAMTNNYQCADTGTKMIHIGKNTKSTIISKGISLGNSRNTFRSLLKTTGNTENVRNYTKCDNLIIGNKASSNAFPTIEDNGQNTTIEHEASVSKISDDQLMFLSSRGIDDDKALSLIVSGFANDIIKKLPSEFMMEAKELINIKLEE